VASVIKTALVVGASRGLGHGLVEQYAERGTEVTGTVREVQQRDRFIANAPGHVTWQLLDITDAESVASFLSGVQHPRYDLIFINAGIGGAEHQSVESATEQETGHLFFTNAVAPLRLAKKLTGHLHPETGIMALMSSRLGSVELAEGSMELYSASKAALNSLSRSYAASVKNTGIAVVSMHPGWVRTDLGGDDAPLDVATSVSGIVKVLDAHVGKAGHHFVDYSGKTLPW
jgi:NAD(P)-dependent dehydrogenase (short-subunit alcohol dehydrogenase family)